MHDQEKSDSAIVAVKSPNKTGYLVAEAMERRAGTEGNADQQSTHRTQIRAARDPGAAPRTASRSALRRQTPEVGAGCSNWARHGSVRGARGNSRPLYVADRSANAHFAEQRGRTVSLLRPFGERARAVD